jgi:hypothetical protein
VKVSIRHLDIPLLCIKHMQPYCVFVTRCISFVVMIGGNSVKQIRKSGFNFLLLLCGAFLQQFCDCSCIIHYMVCLWERMDFLHVIRLHTLRCIRFVVMIGGNSVKQIR